MFYRLLRIQAFMLGAVLFGVVLAFGWVIEHGAEILRFVGLIVLSFIGFLVFCIVIVTVDQQVQKRRDPAAYEARMKAAREQLEQVRRVRRLAAKAQARPGVKGRSRGRKRYQR